MKKTFSRVNLKSELGGNIQETIVKIIATENKFEAPELFRV